MDLSSSSFPFLFAVVLLIWLTAHFVSTKWFLFITGMLVPWVVPRLDIGIGLDWCKIVGPIALGLLVFRRRRSPGPMPTGMGAFIGYSVAVSVVWMVLEYAILHRYKGASAMGLGLAQSYYKMPVQLGSFVGQLLVLYIVPTRATTREEAMAAVRGYAFGVLVSFAFGVLLYLTTGQGMFGRTGMGILEIEGTTLARIGGLSGEPKFLGILVAILLIWELSGAAFGARRRAMIVASAVVLFATLSTSAWAGAVVGGLAILALCFRYPSKANWGIWSIIGVTVLGLLTVGSILTVVMTERFTQRLFGEKSEVGRQKDSYVFNAFAEAPIHGLYGYGLGGGDLAVIPYVPPEELAYQRTPTPGVTGVRILGDLGLIGLSLVIWMAWTWSKQLARQGNLQGAAFALGGLLTVFFGSLLAFSGYLLIMGAVLTAARLEQPRHVTGQATASRGGTSPSRRA